MQIIHSSLPQDSREADNDNLAHSKHSFQQPLGSNGVWSGDQERCSVGWVST